MLKIFLFSKKKKKVLFWTLHILLGGLSAISLSYHAAFRNKVIPFVYIDKKQVSNLSEDKLYEKLEYLGVSNPEIQFNTAFSALKDFDNTKSFILKATDIGFAYDLDSTAAKAFLVGRDKGFMKNLKVKVSLFFSPLHLDPDYYYNEELLQEAVGKIKLEVNTPFNNSYFYISQRNIFIKEEVSGIKIDEDRFKREIINSFAKRDFGQKDLPMSIFRPEVVKLDLESLKNTVSSIVFGSPKLSYKDKKYFLDPQEILDSLTLKKSKDGIILGLNKEVLMDNMDFIAEAINTPPKGEIFKMEGDKVIEFRPSSPGRIVDLEELAGEYSSILLEGKGILSINIPVIEKEISYDANEYGIKELIGVGESKFEGSGSGRILNIKLASGSLDGILIEPEGIFSFNKAVGPIDLEHGYSTAYVIEKGRTVLGPGGGVCQVSTTIFRAALNSGLEITNRVPHAYRVSYYEQESLPGIDATIYQPSVDFKFTNNTSSYILIKTQFDEQNKSLAFKIYGTSDGRKVFISNPVVTSQTPPPEPLYEETDDLAKGVTKQIDWSAWGANVKFTRTVELNGDFLSNDTFTSNYRPWRAVYLVGTKE